MDREGDTRTGLTGAQLENFAHAFQRACVRALFVSQRTHPDDEQAAMQLLNELWLGVLHGAQEMILQSGCPRDDAAIWLDRVIERARPAVSSVERRLW